MGEFAAQVPQNADALPWLTEAPRDKTAPWVQALRATGAEAFSRSGLPTPAWEGWQYTPLRALDTKKFHFATTPAVFDAAKLPKPLLANADRIIVVNGQYQPQLSVLSKEIQVLSLADAVSQKMEGLEHHLASVGDLEATPFKALNTAYMRDGFVLKAAGDCPRTVEVLFYNTSGAAIYPRMLYWLEKNSGLTVLEHHAGEGEYLVNHYTQIAMESASRLKFYRFQDESRDAAHFSLTALSQGKGSSFESFSMAQGARLARQEYRLQLLDPHVSCSIGGIYLLEGSQSHDFTVLADHFEPSGKSAQHFRGVVDDQARAVYQGKIHVRRAAQKTDGYQSHHALLLSRQAEASAKPELEIYADDVKCSHGATSGHLDPAALFYLQSRGIPEAEAKALLIESFLNVAVDIVTAEPVREFYSQQVAAWLGAEK